MATAVKLSGASFSNPLIAALPVIAGNILWNYWGGSLAASQNVGSGGAITSFGAGPSWRDGFGRCLNTNGLAMPFVSPAASTMLFATRYVGGGSLGATVSLCSAGTTGLLCNFSPLSGSVGVTIFQNGVPGTLALAVPTGIEAWRFYAFTSGGGVAQKIYNLTDNTLSADGTTATPAAGTGTFQIGSGTRVAGSNDRTLDMAFTAIYSAVISKASIDAIYASVKQSLAQRGIVV